MKIFFRTLTIFLLLFSLLTLMLFIKPVVTKKQKNLIQKTLDSSTEFNPYLGRTGYAVSQDSIKIWYEDIGNPDNEAILLVMGHSFTALAWPNYFVKSLVAEGYRVIRYDNRGLGLSDRMKSWTKDKAYSTRDMAVDGIAILDELGIDSAHIVGVSMGGMIAQDMAIDYPSRLRSLVIAMSTGELFDKELPKPSAYFITNALRLMAQSKGKFNKNTAPYISVGFSNILSRRKLIDELPEAVEITQFEYTDRGGWSFACAPQHTQAMRVRGGRWDELQQIDARTLIVHGERDPIFKVSHAEKMHRYIPDARLEIMDDLGHFLPEDRSAELTGLLVSHLQADLKQ